MTCLSVHTTAELRVLRLWQVWEPLCRILLNDVYLSARHSVLQKAAGVIGTAKLRFLLQVHRYIHVPLQFILTLLFRNFVMHFVLLRRRNCHRSCVCCISVNPSQGESLFDLIKADFASRCIILGSTAYKLPATLSKLLLAHRQLSDSCLGLQWCFN